MSVLLEALKKAAEEKKNLEESAKTESSKGLDLDASLEESSSLKIEDPVDEAQIEEADWSDTPLFTVQNDDQALDMEPSDPVFESSLKAESNDQLALPHADNERVELSLEENTEFDIKDEFIDYERSPASKPAQKIEFDFDDIDAIDIDSVDIEDLQQSFSLTESTYEADEPPQFSIEHNHNDFSLDNVDLNNTEPFETPVETHSDFEVLSEGSATSNFKDKKKNKKKSKKKKKHKSNKHSVKESSSSLTDNNEDTIFDTTPVAEFEIAPETEIHSEPLTDTEIKTEIEKDSNQDQKRGHLFDDQSPDISTTFDMDLASDFDDSILLSQETDSADEEVSSLIDVLDLDNDRADPLGLTKQSNQKTIDFEDDRPGLGMSPPSGMSMDSTPGMAMDGPTGMGMESKSGMSFEQPTGMSFEQEHSGISFDQAQRAFEDQALDSNSGFSSIDDLRPTESDSQKDSFDWSMDDLPGYQSKDESSSKSKLSDSSESLSTNPIFVSGANTPPPPKPEGVSSSTKMFVSLVVVLFFVLIGFYGIVYYQEQSDDLEQSMMKYNIASLQIKPPVEEEEVEQPIEERQLSAKSDETLVVVPEQQFAETKDIPEEKEAVVEQEFNSDNLAAEQPDTAEVESLETREVKPQEVLVEQEALATETVEKTELEVSSEPPLLAEAQQVVIPETIAKQEPVRNPNVTSQGIVKQLNPVKENTQKAPVQPIQPVQKIVAETEPSYVPKKVYKPTPVAKPKPALPEPEYKKRITPIQNDLPVVRVNKMKSLLAQGYEHYSAGKYQMASYTFRQAIAAEPNNINALMGLGAVETVDRNYVSALGYYEKVLDIAPNNLSALEAIANLSNTVPLNTEWEKQLIEMTKVHPKSAVLHNASGNAYAKNREWLSAQESYFKALVNSPANPNYMVNLAVSYDHLGKYDLAAQYYTQALAYVDIKKVSFDPAQVKARLISIRQLALKKG